MFEAATYIGSTPSLRSLSFALRHPETWPEGFVWDYSLCTKCAAGLAMRLWVNMEQTRSGSMIGFWAAREFSIPMEPANRIFRRLGHINLCDDKDITPIHVADAIDAYCGTISV